MKRRGLALAVGVLVAAAMAAPAAAVMAGQACTKAQVGKTVKAGASTLKCTRVGTRYIWRKVVVPARTVKPSNPIASANLAPLQTYRQGQCTALAPQGWALLPNTNSSAADLVSPDGKQTASWGMIVVPAVVGGMGTLPPYNNADAYSDNPAVALRHYLRYYESAENPAADLAYTSAPAEEFGLYTARLLRSSRNTVQVLYTTFPGDGWSSKYVLVVRLAKTTNAVWAAQGGKLAHYALSIQCITQLSPEGSRAPDPSSRKKADPNKASTTDDDGYNPWLGTEYVHNPSTGQNYTVTTNQWSDTGPQGPGYYASTPSGPLKLAAGRSD